MFGPLRMFGNQQFFRFFPGAAAILFEVPFMGADVCQEPFALRSVRNDAAVGEGGVVVDKDFADIENDVPYFRRQELVPEFLSDGRFCECIGNSLSDRFFHDCRQGLLFKICNRLPPSVMVVHVR